MVVKKSRVDNFTRRGGIIEGNDPDTKIKKFPKPKTIRVPRRRQKSPVSRKVKRRKQDPLESVSLGFGGF